MIHRRAAWAVLYLGLIQLLFNPTQQALAGPSMDLELSESPIARQRGQRIEVLFTSDIYGRFAWPGCKARDREHGEIAHLLGAARGLRDKARLGGEPRPLLLLGGSTLRPDILGSYVFGDDPPLAKALGEALSRLAPDAIGVGLYDFGASPEALRSYLRTLQAAKIPALAGNVSCKSQADYRCKAMARGGSRYRIIERGGIKIAVYAVLRGDLTQRVLKRSRNIDVADPVKFSRELIGRLRTKHGVDVVVALANLNLESETPGPVLDYVRALGTGGPDLLIASGMFERSSHSGYLSEIRRGHTTIVGTDRFAQHIGRAVIHFKTVGAKRSVARIAVEHLSTRGFKPDPKAAKLGDRLIRSLCEQVDQPLGKGHFAKPLTYDEFLRYLMSVMRKRTGTEIAMINISGIADTGFPMVGRVTWEKLLRAIRTETHVGTVILSGARLKSLLGPYVGGKKEGLKVLGVSSSMRINGRPLISGADYKVALTRFVATGGDRLIRLRADERFSDMGVQLRDLTTDFFGGDGQAHFDRKSDVSADNDFPDLARRWLLFGGMDVGFDLSNVSIQNGPDGDRYSLPQLRRDSLTTIAAKVAFNLGAATEDHALEIDGLLSYGRSYTRPQGTDETTIGESVDRITGSFIYKLRRFKRGKDVSWFIPEPYAEARLVSEFTASGICDPLVCKDSADQSYHYMDVGGTVGLGLQPHPLLFVKLGAVMRGEVLTPDAKNPDITARPGIYIGYLLRKWQVSGLARFPIHLKSRMDFYFTDFAGGLRREFTLSSKLYVGLTRRISLTVGHQFYAFAKRSVDTAWGNDIAVGLSLAADFRRQTH